MHDQEVNPSEIVDEGKTVDDAIEKGAQRLGVPREELDYEVLEQGTQGVFGIGAKPAKVIVRRKAAVDDVSSKVEEIVTEVMKLAGINAQVKTSVEDEIHRVEIETAGVDGLLIGKKGESLEDLGHLLRRMVGKQLKKSVRMDVDVGGYKRRRGGALRDKAISLASRVKATGKEMQMEPLSAAERRVVHLAVADDPQIKTYTVGEGDLKNVVISPARRNIRNSDLAGRKGGRQTGAGQEEEDGDAEDRQDLDSES
jgi:spoIIIJ-associated protein